MRCSWELDSRRVGKVALGRPFHDWSPRYTPSRVTLTTGQHTEIRPALFGPSSTTRPVFGADEAVQSLHKRCRHWGLGLKQHMTTFFFSHSELVS